MKTIRDLLIVLLGIPTVLLYILCRKVTRMSKKKAQKILDDYLQKNVDSSLKSKDIQYGLHGGNMNFNMFTATVFDPHQVEFNVSFDAKVLKKQQILIQDFYSTLPFIEQYKNAQLKQTSHTKGSMI